MSTRIAAAASAMRKAPRQARSRATVEAVIDAGARILSERGWGGFTTNKVAEVAGVSIGSLYQYFPDKVSLVAAIRRRHLDDSLAAVLRAEASGESAADFAEALIANLIQAHRLYPGLQRVLLDEAPGMDAFLEQNVRIEAEYLGCFTRAVARFCARRSDAGDETIGMLVSDAIDGVIHGAARRGTLSDPVIARELVRLISHYLDSEGIGPARL